LGKIDLDPRQAGDVFKAEIVRIGQEEIADRLFVGRLGPPLVDVDVRAAGQLGRRPCGKAEKTD
jgi:hypothetical protein